MEKITLDVSGNRAFTLPIDTALSFTPFIKYLQKRAEEERTVKAGIYRAALEQFAQYDVLDKDIPLERIYEYEPLLEQMYACLSPALADERELSWALCFPFQPIVFYSTEGVCRMLSSNQPDVSAKTPADYHRDRLQLFYNFLLERLYNFRSPLRFEQYHAWTNTETGLLQYYAVQVNTDFIEVTAKGALPELDLGQLQTAFTEGSVYETLQSMLPPEQFRLRGIAVINVVDVTTQQAVDNIADIRLSRTPGEEAAGYQRVIQSLKTLVQDGNVEFDLFPFVRVNNKAVYGYAKAGTGVLFSVWGEQRLSPEDFSRQAEQYFSNPNSFFSPDITRETGKDASWLIHFIRLNVRSLALIPVFHNRQVVGVLAMHTFGDHTFDEKKVAMLEPAIAPIAQLLQVYIDEFNLEIENIIKEKFTSIQPAVQWKFNEVAWRYLHSRKKNQREEPEIIRFNEVYPLYGAVDIRNSTLERNLATRADLGSHLDLLSATLTAVQPYHRSALLEEIAYNCRKWQETLQQEQFNATDETNLNYFLDEEVAPYLLHLAQQDPKVRGIVEAYLQALDTATGKVYVNRRDLETSIQMINNAINQYIEAEKEPLQQSYPCYFEKFRTDGIEYDIYIGQSLAPDKPFNNFHLKNLRLWQLSSMAAIARTTRSLLPNMPRELRTTQLIFVHNHTIDISFRTDEKKFDVEGGYNIRYQMIKKRIDKVHIRNTTERLTQPDKIALIYFNKKDVEDYLPFIQYLQETKVLHPLLEELELEDLQGLSGLKALRCSVI